MASAIASALVSLVKPEPAGAQARLKSCFICNNNNASQTTDQYQFPSHPELEIVNCICNLFDLEPDLYHQTLSEEVICEKCQQILQSVVTAFEEMERLHNEVEKSRKLLQDWLSASFGANQSTIRDENDGGESRSCTTRVYLQGKIIGKDPKSSASSNPDSTCFGEDEEVEYVVYEIEESSTGLPRSPEKPPGPGFHSTPAAQVEEQTQHHQGQPAITSLAKGRGPSSRTRNKSNKSTTLNSTTVTKSESPSLGTENPDPVGATQAPKTRTRGLRPSRSRFESENFDYYDVGKIFVAENSSWESSPSICPSPKKLLPTSSARVESEPNEVQTHKNRRQRNKKKLDEHIEHPGLPSPIEDDSTSQSLKFACKICGKPFKTSEYAVRHEQTHNSPDKPFKCLAPDCALAYSSDRAFNRHVLKFHSPSATTECRRPRSRQNSCELCGKSFRTPYMLKQHVETHKPHEERKYNCEVCGFGFLELCRMRRHMKRVHDPSYKLARGPLPKKPCPVCGVSVVNLASHQRVHTSEKSFVCTDCGKSFLAKKTLDVHARIHTDSRPYPCSQCDAKFRTSHGLSRHAFIHSDERLFVCEHCGKAFRFKSSLSEHLHVHLKVKPYRCNVCGRRCKQAQELDEHLLKDHTPEQLKRRRVRVRRQNPENSTAATVTTQLEPSATAVSSQTAKYEFVIEDVVPTRPLGSVDSGVGPTTVGVSVEQTQVLHTITIPATTLAGFIGDGSRLNLISASNQSVSFSSGTEGTLAVEGQHPGSRQENSSPGSGCGDGGPSTESKIRCTALAHPEADGQVLMGYQLQYI